MANTDNFRVLGDDYGTFHGSTRKNPTGGSTKNGGRRRVNGPTTPDHDAFDEDAGTEGFHNDLDRDPLIQPGSQDGNQDLLFCSNCAQNLCQRCTQVLEVLSQRQEECNDLYNVTPFQLAMKRMPALIVTMLLELIGGIVVNLLSTTLEKFVLLASFMPVISALSGNLGLQTSSNITRGLGTGNVKRGEFKGTIKKEILTGIFCSFTIALLLGLTGGIWSFLAPNEKELRSEIYLYPLIFASVVLIGTLLSMMISSTNGTLTPMAAYLLGLDPAKIAGPLETAFQDIAGQSFLLGFAYLILIPQLPSPPTTTTVMPTTTILPNLTFT